MLLKLYGIAESLAPPGPWPPLDMLVQIEGAVSGPYGTPLSPHARSVRIPPSIAVPSGMSIYHGTSSESVFDVPRGPASFSLDRKTAQGYADNEHSGGSHRVMGFMTTTVAKFVDHPGAGHGSERAAEWLKRWQAEVMGDHSHIAWSEIGFGRVPLGLSLLRRAGFDGIRIAMLDDGGQELCYFDPQRFVRPHEPTWAAHSG